MSASAAWYVSRLSTRSPYSTISGARAPAGPPEQVAQPRLELLRVERRQAEVVEQVLAQLELAELRAAHEQQDRLERRVALAQRAADPERALGVVVGARRPRRPSRRSARAGRRATRSRPPSTGSPRGRASARAAAAAGRGRRAAAPSRGLTGPLTVAQVAVELQRRDLRRVVGPLRALVADEVLEDVLAERLGDELGALHHVDGLGERLRQRVDALGRALLGGHLVDVVGGLGREVVALLDALEAGGEHHREREVRVARRVGRAELDAGRALLALLRERDAHERRVVVAGPADVGRRLVADDQPLVGVDPLVRDRGDLAGVAQQPGDEVLPTFDSPYSSPGSWNALTSPSKSERWVCMPEPNARRSASA